MGYEDSEAINHKTGRIAILSILIFSLGCLFFAYKVGACRGDTTSTAAPCKDEFHEFKSSDSRYSTQVTCQPGASVEMVNSPPAPKAGILCRCNPTRATVGLPTNPTN